MNITIIMGVALAISMAANALTGWAYIGAREEIAAGKVLLEDARGAASACSDATDALRDLADQRAKEAKTARTAADLAAKDRDQRADDILSTAASDPDDCKAAQQRATTWLKGRK